MSDKTYRCEVCGKEYRSQGHLANHVARHKRLEETAVDYREDMAQIASAMKMLIDRQEEDHQLILNLLNREDSEKAQARAAAEAEIARETEDITARRKVKYDLVANAPKVEVIVTEPTNITVNGYSVHIPAGVAMMVPQPIKDVLYQQIAENAKAENRRRMLSSLGTPDPAFLKSGGTYAVLQEFLGQQRTP